MDYSVRLTVGLGSDRGAWADRPPPNKVVLAVLLVLVLVVLAVVVLVIVFVRFVITL